MKRIAMAWFTAVVFTPAFFAQDTARLASPPTSTQDATVAAPKNYKVEYENDVVRIVRVTYGPHEKSPMHTHHGNAVVVVVLKGGAQMNSINEDGTKTLGRREQTGAVRFVPSRPAFMHSSENTTDFPLETIRVELKTPSCRTKWRKSNCAQTETAIRQCQMPAIASLRGTYHRLLLGREGVVLDRCPQSSNYSQACVYFL